MKVGDHVYHCIRDKFEVKVHDITESNLESAEFHVQEGAMHLTYEPAAKELLNYVNDEVSSTEQKFNEIQTKLIFLKEKQIEVNNLIQQTMTTELHNLGYRLIDIRKVPNKLMLWK